MPEEKSKTRHRPVSSKRPLRAPAKNPPEPMKVAARRAPEKTARTAKPPARAKGTRDRPASPGARVKGTPERLTSPEESAKRKKKVGRKPSVPLTPKPSDLVRPAPDEPVRIQPPPELVEARRRTERAAWDANRWVRQRQNFPRGGRRQTHGHPSVRGR